MNLFLKLKHWQLFILLFGVPIIFQIITVGSAISGNNPTAMLYLFPVMMILIVTFYFGWFYTLGTNLYKKIPQARMMNLVRFKTFMFIPVVYILVICVFMIVMMSNSETNRDLNPIIFLIVFPLHLFSMFCIFYSLYFNAKALKIAEWQRPVTFSDYAGEFFLMWFLPVGIWILQPRINKLFDTVAPEKDNYQEVTRNIV